MRLEAGQPARRPIGEARCPERAGGQRRRAAARDATRHAAPSARGRRWSRGRGADDARGPRRTRGAGRPLFSIRMSARSQSASEARPTGGVVEIEDDAALAQVPEQERERAVRRARRRRRRVASGDRRRLRAARSGSRRRRDRRACGPPTPRGDRSGRRRGGARARRTTRGRAYRKRRAASTLRARHAAKNRAIRSRSAATSWRPRSIKVPQKAVSKRR